MTKYPKPGTVYEFAGSLGRKTAFAANWVRVVPRNQVDAKRTLRPHKLLLYGGDPLKTGKLEVNRRMQHDERIGLWHAD
jgi:hypothetical protein